MAPPVVQICDGKLKGREWQIANGDKVLAFLGIPYAKPPLGELRFKAPQPVDPWDGIRDATKDGDNCVCEDFLNKTVGGSEDCLFVNVFTKSLSSDKPKPVMVFIHGGGFIGGSNNSKSLNPDFLLAEDVILVTVNYRLGIFGFLSLDDTSLGIPGNAGLKDQSLALRWVQKNILHFGGNPNNVTLFGESAGGASVHFQILSASSKGLFHKAILQSGSVHNPWPYGTAPLLEVLKASGVDVPDERSGLKFIQNASTMELNKIQTIYLQSRGEFLRVYGPVVEKPNPTAFITEEPVDIIASGNYSRVPIILGYCEMEAIIFEIVKKRLHNDDVTLEKQLQKDMGLQSKPYLLNWLTKTLEEAYITSGMEHGEIMLFSDLLFIAGIIASAKLHAATNPSPVYLYRFSFVGGLNSTSIMMKQLLPGASHADDMGYLFRPDVVYDENSIEELTVNRMVKLWTNFAKTSNPTPKINDLGVTWNNIERENTYYLDINKTLTLGINPEEDRMELWERIYEHFKAQDFKMSGS